MDEDDVNTDCDYAVESEDSDGETGSEKDTEPDLGYEITQSDFGQGYFDVGMTFANSK